MKASSPQVPVSNPVGTPVSSGPGMPLLPRQSAPMEYPAMMAISMSKVPPSMFRQALQTGFLSVLYALGQKPLDLWEKQVRSGYVKRINDSDIKSLAIEIMSPNIGTTFITTPPLPAQSLGIRLPIVILVLKNLRRYFMFEVSVLDETKTRRRFVFSNFTQGAKIRPFSTTVPIRLEEGWNQLSLNLKELTQKVYSTEYKETLRIQVHPNCRLRRIYFCDRVYTEDEVPLEFKLSLLNAAAAKTEESQSSVGSTPTPTVPTLGPALTPVPKLPNVVTLTATSTKSPNVATPPATSNVATAAANVTKFLDVATTPVTSKSPNVATGPVISKFPNVATPPTTTATKFPNVIVSLKTSENSSKNGTSTPIGRLILKTTTPPPSSAPKKA